MTFKIVVEDPKTLTDFAAIINVLADEATLNFTDKGITVSLMDPSRVAMINLYYPKSMFTEYQTDAPQKIGLNITELLRLLKRAGKEDHVTLETLPAGKLQLTFDGPITCKFTLPTIETNIDEAPTPKTPFNTKASLTTHALTQCIEDTQTVSDHLWIKTENEALQFTAEGDLMDADVTMQKGSDGLLNLDVKAPSKACYSLSYLTEIVKAGASISDLVNLEYNSDMPLKLDFIVQEGNVSFYLAPRLETE